MVDAHPHDVYAICVYVSLMGGQRVERQGGGLAHLFIFIVYFSYLVFVFYFALFLLLNCGYNGENHLNQIQTSGRE